MGHRGPPARKVSCSRLPGYHAGALSIPGGIGASLETVWSWESGRGHGPPRPRTLWGALAFNSLVPEGTGVIIPEKRV